MQALNTSTHLTDSLHCTLSTNQNGAAIDMDNDITAEDDTPMSLSISSANQEVFDARSSSITGGYADASGIVSSNRRKQTKPSRMAKEAAAAAALSSSMSTPADTNLESKEISTHNENKINYSPEGHFDVNSNNEDDTEMETNSNNLDNQSAASRSPSPSKKIDGQLTCSICSQNFPTESQLAQHVINLHQKTSPLMLNTEKQRSTEDVVPSPHESDINTEHLPSPSNNNNLPSSIVNKFSSQKADEMMKQVIPDSTKFDSNFNPSSMSFSTSGLMMPSPSTMQTFSSLNMSHMMTPGQPNTPVSNSNNNTPNNSNRDEDYCEMCQKHFCNKYYLRKHKNDVHGIPSEPLPNSRGGGSHSSTSRNKDYSANSSLSHHPHMQQTPSSLAALSSPFNTGPPLPQHPMFMSPHMMSQLSASNFMLFNPFAAAAAGSPMSLMNPTAAAHFLAMSGSAQLGGASHSFPGAPGSMVPPPLGHMSLPGVPVAMDLHLHHQQQQQHQLQQNNHRRSPTSRDSETFCDICNKELCNKYFLRIHKAKKHGIKDESLDTSTCGSLPVSSSPTTGTGPVSFNSLSNSQEHANSNVNSARQFNTNLKSESTEHAVINSSNIKSTGEPENLSMPKLEPISDYKRTPVLSSPKMASEASPQHSPCKPMASPDSLLPTSLMGNSMTPNKSESQTNRQIDPETYCGICQRDMGNKYALKIHFLSVHTAQGASGPGMMDPSCFLSGPDSSSLAAAMAAGLSLPSSMADHRNNIMVSSSSPSATHGLSPPMDSFKNSMIAAKLADRVMCDICNKDLCNKYFLKTHKMKVHGVMTPSEPGSSAGSSAAGGCNMTNSLLSSPGPNLKMENKTMGSNETQDDMGFCDICQKEVGPKYQLLAHMLTVHNTTSAANLQSMQASLAENAVMSMAPSHNAGSTTSNDSNGPYQMGQPPAGGPRGNGGGSQHSQEGGYSSNQDSPGSRPSQSRWSHESPNQMRVLCDICQRWMCNKYFLRTHKFNKHGISDTGSESTPSAAHKQHYNLPKHQPTSCSQSPTNLSTNVSNKGETFHASQGSDMPTSDTLDATIDSIVNTKMENSYLTGSNPSQAAAMQAALAAQQYYNTTRDYLSRQYAVGGSLHPAGKIPGTPTHTSANGLPPPPPPVFFDPTGGLLARPPFPPGSPPNSSSMTSSDSSAMATMASMAAMAAAQYGVHGFLAPPPPPLGFPGSQHLAKFGFPGMPQHAFQHLLRRSNSCENAESSPTPDDKEGKRSVEESSGSDDGGEFGPTVMPMCGICGLLCPDHTQLRKHVTQVHSNVTTSGDKRREIGADGGFLPLDLCVASSSPSPSSDDGNATTEDHQSSKATNMAALRSLRRACNQQNGHDTGAKRRKLGNSFKQKASSNAASEASDDEEDPPAELKWRFECGECGTNFASRTLLQSHVTETRHWSRSAVERVEPVTSPSQLSLNEDTRTSSVQPSLNNQLSPLHCPLCQLPVTNLVQHLVKEHDIEREARLLQAERRNKQQRGSKDTDTDVKNKEMETLPSIEVETDFPAIDRTNDMDSDPGECATDNDESKQISPNPSTTTALDTPNPSAPTKSGCPLNLSLIAQQ